jgi:nucleotide-binding universal stress UspA family protein
MRKIVVGVDGSSESRAALAFALSEARAHGAAVTAVCAWHIPTPAYGAGVAAPFSGLAGDFERDAAASLDAAIEALGADRQGVVLEKTVREGQPARVLIEAARDAGLLVVGSRGRGGFTGLLLGSVGQQCAHHAPCPIVICPGHVGT